LRCEIEALLCADALAGDILDLPEESPENASEHVLERPGTSIGPYTLRHEIGEGGMGTVWMAEQTRPVRRTVALKIIKPGMDSRQVIARFEAERQALAILDHPNIAKVLDAGTTKSGRPYFVMELVQGEPITQYCDSHSLNLRERLELFVSVCQAVQHAHQKGIIHRDLKPSNVLVALYDEHPVPKVIDFGVAKATGPNLNGQTAFTQCGQLIGTLEYMSPEQASFNVVDIDTRSDIYSLGVILYELLTGSTPFEKARLHAAAFDEVVRIIREEEPPRPSTRLSELFRSNATTGTSVDGNSARDVEAPETEVNLASIAARRRTEPGYLGQLVKGDLDWIVMKALEKDRNRRYETANGLKRDLQRFLADEPVAACPPSLRYRLRKFVRRNRVPVVAASLVVLALVGGIIGMTWGMFRATQARAVTAHEARQKEVALAEAQRSARDATDQLFLALWNRARAGRYSRQIGQRLETLQAVAQAARIRPDDLLRDEAIAALAVPDVRRVPAGHWRASDTITVAFGGQYRLYARAHGNGTITVHRIPSGEEIERIASGPITPGSNLYFSPDERFLVGYGPNRTLRVWRVAGGQPALEEAPSECDAHVFSPDESQLSVGQQELVLCFDLATGKRVRQWRAPAPVWSLAFHPDQSKLAVGYQGPSIVSVYEWPVGRLLADLPVGQTSKQIVAWHPDGERLAVAGSDPRIQIWNVAAKRKVATLEGHAQRVEAITFHPEGGVLASYSWDGALRFWDAATGRALLQMPLILGDRPRFSGDGRWVGAALHNDKVDLLEVTPSREYRTLVTSAGGGRVGLGHGAISHDGRLLAVALDVGARVWDLRSGRELAALPAGTSFVEFERRGHAADGCVASDEPPWSLLTSGFDGLLRWPATSHDPQGKLQLGPPQQLSQLRRAFFARTPEGRTLVAATEEGGTNQILDAETGRVERVLGSHPNGEVRTLSADGRWAASSGWHSDRARLWNAHTGQMVKEWILGKRTFPFFTPDSHVLIISKDDEFSFWDVETLQQIRVLRRDVAQFPGWVAIAPDGRLMAMEMAPAEIHLKEVATGRTVAKLEDPHSDRATWQGFTPDGTRLVVVAAYAGAIHIWDLRAIRKHLKEMNLDWDWPEFPSQATAATETDRARIEVIPADRRQVVLTRQQKAERSIASSRRAWQARPDSAQACNNLAWSLAAAPEMSGNVEEAVNLAEKAVRLAAHDPSYRNTLGVAYYRAGRYSDAVSALRPNLDRQRDWALPFDLYVLAMSYHRLGELARARDYYDWAVRWVESERGLDPRYFEELAAFRAEAEELLQIDPKKD
jgi:serine/threonine protein kinase/WD40 repeat protein